MSENAVDASIARDNIQESIGVLEAFADESRLYFFDDGLYGVVQDKANVAMSQIDLSDTAFTSYGADASDDESVLFGADLSRLDEVVGMASSGGTIHMTLPDRHSMSMESGGLSYNLTGINTDTIRKEPEIPDLEFDTDAAGVPADELSRAVKAADMVSDHVAFEADADEDTLHITAEGDTDNVSVELTDECESLDIESDTRGLFAVGYLQNAIRAIPSDDAVRIGAKTDFPLQIDFTVAEGHGDATFIIAPRIENG